jgi:NAD(P)-dependent dehydrogenase (short-subunit alcohol dehydrogenase family)
MDKIWYNLEGKVVVVTGGSRGIGLELARLLLEQKAKVVICGRKQEGLDAATSELNAGEDLLAIQTHIAKEEDVESLFDKTIENFGRFDVLINNVGMKNNEGSEKRQDCEYIFHCWKKGFACHGNLWHCKGWD